MRIVMQAIKQKFYSVIITLLVKYLCMAVVTVLKYTMKISKKTTVFFTKVVYNQFRIYQFGSSGEKEDEEISFDSR